MTGLKEIKKGFLRDRMSDLAVFPHRGKYREEFQRKGVEGPRPSTEEPR